MLSQIRSQRLVWAGGLAALAAILSAFPLAASEASQQPTALTSPHLISPKEAQEMIARFRATAPPGAVLAQTFHRGAFDALLAQPAAAGIRIYYGKYASGADTLVLYVTNGEGQDLSAMPMNHCMPCPALCESLPANSHLISPTEAQETVDRFQDTAPPGAVLSQYLDRSAFDALLAQPTAAGIRIYYGKYADGAKTLVLYAINKQGQILSAMAMDHCTPCPPLCDAQAATTRSNSAH